MAEPIQCRAFSRRRRHHPQLLVACTALVLSAYTAKDEDAGPGTFRGAIVFGFEASEFRPDGSNERWWVGGATEPLRAALTADSRTIGGSLSAELEGDLSSPRQYRHMRAYARELVVRRVVAIRDVCLGSLRKCAR